MKALPSIAFFALPTLLSGQSTWIVNSGGGAGVHFTDLAAAVAAANHGDTLLVQPDAFNTPYGGFTTDKGIRVIGLDSRLSTMGQPVRIQNLAAGRTFALVGFDAPRDTDMRVFVTNCAGHVHLEDLHAVEFGASTPVPAIDVHSSAFVSLLDVEDFGFPALRTDFSFVLAVRCRFGLTSIGIGIGNCIEATDAVVHVVEPMFRAPDPTLPAIRALRSVLVIGGTAQSYIQGGEQAGTAAAAIEAFAGEVRVDPAVRLNPITPSSQPITGTAVVSRPAVPAAQVTADAPGGPLAVTWTAPAGSLLLGVLGLPDLPFPTPLGVQFLAPQPLDVLFITTVAAAGTHTSSLPIPATLPRGLLFGVQPLVLQGANLALGEGCDLAVH